MQDSSVNHGRRHEAERLLTFKGEGGMAIAWDWTVVRSGFLLACNVTFGVSCLMLTICDLAWRRLPNPLTSLLALSGVCQFLVLEEPAHLLPRLSLIILAGGAAWLLRRLLNQALRTDVIGMGDVKMFGAAFCWIPPGQAVGFLLLLALLMSVARALPGRNTTSDFPAGIAMSVALSVLKGCTIIS